MKARCINGIRPWLGIALAAATALATAAPPSANKPKSALVVPLATQAPLTAVAKAGERIVAVGDYGVVLLSDDDGRTYRQARSVPVRAMLTSVFFRDGRNGWAGGHDGVVLRTADGGETWSLLREESGAERPVLSLWFEDDNHGFAVGLFGMALETQDGGRTWREIKVADGEDADRHFYQVFGGPGGSVLIAAEAGTMFRSPDGGKTWTIMRTGQKGSLWCGTALRDGTLLMAGMRGNLFRSTDGGKIWNRIEVGTTSSLTAIDVGADGGIVVVGMDGTVLDSRDGGASFKLSMRPDGAPLTGVVHDKLGSPVFVGATGGMAQGGQAK